LAQNSLKASGAPIFLCCKFVHNSYYLLYWKAKLYHYSYNILYIKRLAGKIINAWLYAKLRVLSL